MALPKKLSFVVLLGILCHVVLLGFELPILVAAAQSVVARQPVSTAGMAQILVAHTLINTGLGLVFALLAKPQPLEALIYGGVAAGLPNAVCTFAGALLVLNNAGSELSKVLGFRLLEPGVVFGIVLFSLFTGLLAAPLGMAGAALTASFVSAK